jgi:hypothetical protein
MHAHALAVPRTASGTRPAAIAIAAATVLSTVFVALDHSGGGTTPPEILAGIARLALLKEMVHGVAIASVCAYAFGYTVLARELGFERPPVLAGLLAYLFGCGAMIGATLLDGFVTPHVAIDAAQAAPARVAFAFDLVHYLNIVLNDLSRFGWTAQALAAAAWSLLLVGRSGTRLAGWIGLLSSALMVALMTTSAIRMDMPTLLGVLVAQLLWNLTAAVLLWRGPNVPARIPAMAG